MAQYYGEIKGAKGTVTKEGTSQSGIEAHIRGYNVGVRIECSPDRKSGKPLDQCEVFLTGGSNSPKNIKLIAVVGENPRKGDRPYAWNNEGRIISF